MLRYVSLTIGPVVHYLSYSPNYDIVETLLTFCLDLEMSSRLCTLADDFV